MKPVKKHKTLFLRHDQLMDEISMQLDIVAEMRPNDDGTPNDKISNAINKYHNQFVRWIDKYVDLTKSRMAAYVMTIERKAVMNAKRPWDEAVFHLEFPPTWNETTFTNLADAVQQYIVNSVLKEYFILAITSKDPVTIDKTALADDAYGEIKHCCVSQIPGAAKKTLHPF